MNLGNVGCLAHVINHVQLACPARHCGCVCKGRLTSISHELVTEPLEGCAVCWCCPSVAIIGHCSPLCSFHVLIRQMVHLRKSCHIGSECSSYDNLCSFCRLHCRQMAVSLPLPHSARMLRSGSCSGPKMERFCGASRSWILAIPKESRVWRSMLMRPEQRPRARTGSFVCGTLMSGKATGIELWCFHIP